jgi:serine/threonine kinase 32
MQRKSYYPHNQHLISTATATSSGLASSRPGTPANDLRVENSGLRVEGDMPMEDGGGIMDNSNCMDGRDYFTLKEVRVEHTHLEKGYP